MPEQNDPFFPRRVDESVENLLSTERFRNGQRRNKPATPDEHLVHDLQQLYGPDSRRYAQAIQRVEDRLVERRLTRNGSGPNAEPVPRAQYQQSRQARHVQQGRFNTMENKQFEYKRPAISKFRQRAGLLVAVLVVVVLVGSLALVLGSLHQPAGLTLTGSSNPTPTPTLARVSTPTPTATSMLTLKPAFGRTVYTTPGNAVGFNGLAWSPDSRRVASSTVSGVQIWDATTGTHLVKVARLTNTFAYGLAWSPNSQTVAIATNQSLLLVNGQSGAVEKTYSASMASVSSVHNRSIYLSMQIPAGGGLGFRAITWSPDGKYIAVAISLGATGEIQIINAQTLASTSTIQVSDNYNPSALAWSSDGQYLAANVFNTEPGDQTVPQDQEQMVWVWKLSTQQVVFKQDGGDNAIAFQPGSDNLVFQANSTSLQRSLQTWNVVTDKLVIDYHQSGSGALVWSPDDRYLAYAKQTVTGQGSVGILDAKTGQEIYTYTGNSRNVCQLAWSPDGKYIVSGEGQTSGTSLVAKVWTAES